MRGRFSSFEILFLFLLLVPAFACAAAGTSCRTVRVSEIPSPHGELHAVIVRSDCDERKSQLSHPWTSLYIIKSGADLDDASPLYLFGYPDGHTSIESIKKGVPLRVQWDPADRLTIRYPLGTVVRYVPWGDAEMQKVFWHGITTLPRADASLGNLRNMKAAAGK